MLFRSDDHYADAMAKAKRAADLQARIQSTWNMPQLPNLPGAQKLPPSAANGAPTAK